MFLEAVRLSFFKLLFSFSVPLVSFLTACQMCQIHETSFPQNKLQCIHLRTSLLWFTTINKHLLAHEINFHQLLLFSMKRQQGHL